MQALRGYTDSPAGEQAVKICVTLFWWADGLSLIGEMLKLIICAIKLFFNASNKNSLPNLDLLAHFDAALTVFHLPSLLEPWQQWP